MTERRDHEGLGAEAEALLRALRTDDDMPPATQARVWRRLAASTEGAGPQEHVRRGMSPGAWSVVVLAAAAALLLASRAGVLGPLVADRGGEAAKYSEVEPEPAPVVARQAGPERARAAAGGTSEHVREDMVEEPPRAEPQRAQRPARARADEKAGGSSGAGAEEPGAGAGVRAGDAEGPAAGSGARADEGPGAGADGPESSLAEEAAALGRAQAALQGGRAEAGLAELAGYARRFPQGALREEYEALRAIALCEGGRTREGRGEAQAFLRDRAGSALVDRVRRACLEGQ